MDIWTGQACPDAEWARDTGAIVFSATKGVASTILHRLADHGLLDYDVPVATYWPEFGVAGKDRITVRQLMTHRAGLSALPTIAAGAQDVLDHELMEQRLAAAAPDRLLGVPAYHAFTYGWLVAGLARAITGSSLAELFRTEVAEPLGVDGIHLGRPPEGSPTPVAALCGSKLSVVGAPLGALFFGHAYGLPGTLGAAARALFLPGIETLVAGDDPPVLHTELGAGNGVCTAPALATLYGALAGDGTVAGRRYLSARTVQGLRRVQTYRPDHTLFYMPMMWHLGYHSMPTGTQGGFGHIGLGGSFGCADPRLGLSIGFVHNRLDLGTFARDQLASTWILPLAARGARAVARREEVRARRAA